MEYLKRNNVDQVDKVIFLFSDYYCSLHNVNITRVAEMGVVVNFVSLDDKAGKFKIM